MLRRNGKGLVGLLSVLLTVGAIPLVGCQEGVESEQSENREQLDGANLPENAVSVICGPEEPDPLEKCEWIHSLDGLVYGEVNDVQFVNNPAYTADTEEKVDQCPERVMIPALELRVDVVDSFAGSFSEGETIDVRVGGATVYDWEPYPVPVEQGSDEFTWSDEDKALKPGDSLGLPIHEFPETGHLTIDPELLFSGMYTDDGIEFQPGEYCSPRYPEELVGMMIEDFADAVDGCDGTGEDAGSDRKDAILGHWDQEGHGLFSVGAECDIVEEEGEEQECYYEDDCPNQICVDGECIDGECKRDSTCLDGFECVDYECVEED